MGDCNFNHDSVMQQPHVSKIIASFVLDLEPKKQFILW